MPLFIIERDFSNYSDAELEAAAFRSTMCTAYFPGMRWLRSFFDAEARLSRCIYEADLVTDILRHAHAADLPCDRIRPLIEVWPSLSGGVEHGNAQDGAPLRDSSGALALWMARHRLPHHSAHELAKTLQLSRTSGDETWVRSYIDSQAGELISIYRTATRQSADAQAARLHLELLDLRSMLENVPADFLSAEAGAAAV